MRTKLAIIAVSGFAVSVVCLSGPLPWAAMPSAMPFSALIWRV